MNLTNTAHLAFLRGRKSGRPLVIALRLRDQAQEFLLLLCAGTRESHLIPYKLEVNYRPLPEAGNGR
jgi:hypothetical protein